MTRHKDFFINPQIYKLSLKSEHCKDVHRILPIECICAFAYGEEGDKTRSVVSLTLFYIQLNFTGN